MARNDGVIVRQVDEETLVYDSCRDTAICLNDHAARIWRLCDGETTVADIARDLGDDERRVWLALDQLAKSHLLIEHVAPPRGMKTAKNRREFISAMGAGAALVTLITVPTPAQAISCGTTGNPCFINGQCCSHLCVAGFCT